MLCEISEGDAGMSRVSPIDQGHCMELPEGNGIASPLTRIVSWSHCRDSPPVWVIWTCWSETVRLNWAEVWGWGEERRELPRKARITADITNSAEIIALRWDFVKFMAILQGKNLIVWSECCGEDEALGRRAPENEAHARGCGCGRDDQGLADSPRNI